jgi:hypothetical protein
MPGKTRFLATLEMTGETRNDRGGNIIATFVRCHLDRKGEISSEERRDFSLFARTGI